MTTQEQIDIMVAYTKGAKIQRLVDVGKWVDDEHPTWDWELSQYRIKPEEQKEEERRPFTYEEACQHIGEVIYKNDGKCKRLICSVNNDCNPFQINGFTAKFIFDNYHFADGTPCGAGKFNLVLAFGFDNKFYSFDEKGELKETQKCCQTCKYGEATDAGTLICRCLECTSSRRKWEVNK